MAKIESVKTWPSPKTITDVRSFMGTCSYYRRFIKDFAAIARPMHKLTEKNCPFNWTQECETAFQKLKITLITAPVLGLPGRWIISKLYVLSIWSHLHICPSGFLNLSSHVNEP
jgi:hypothetical protein